MIALCTANRPRTAVAASAASLVIGSHDLAMATVALPHRDGMTVSVAVSIGVSIDCVLMLPIGNSCHLATRDPAPGAAFRDAEGGLAGIGVGRQKNSAGHKSHRVQRRAKEGSLLSPVPDGVCSSQDNLAVNVLFEPVEGIRIIRLLHIVHKHVTVLPPHALRKPTASVIPNLAFPL